MASIFDQFISPPGIGDAEAKRLRGLQVDVQLNFSYLLDRQVGRLLTSEDTTAIPCLCLHCTTLGKLFLNPDCAKRTSPRSPQSGHVTRSIRDLLSPIALAYGQVINS
jgi:hypothetical protein